MSYTTKPNNTNNNLNKYTSVLDMLQKQGQQEQIDRFGGIGQTSYRSNLDRFLDAINIGSYTMQGFIHGAITPGESALGDAWEGLKAGNPFGQGNTKGEYTFGNNLEQMGWKPTTAFGKIAKGVVGFIGDVALDPLTYATLGGSSIAKGTGTKIAKGFKDVEEVSRFTPEMAQSVLKEINKSANYVASEKEVSDLMERVNRLTGVAKPKEVGIGWKGSELPLSKYLGAIGKDYNFVDDSVLREFGDKTIAPYFNAIQDKFQHSKLFSTKGDMIDLARKDPQTLVKLFEYKSTSLERGVTQTEALQSLKDEYKKFNSLDPKVQQQITNILEDKDFWKDSTKIDLKDTTQGKKLYDKMAKFVKNFGNHDPEMAKVMKDIEPKFKVGDSVIARTESGDMPVKITGEYGVHPGGEKYYKIEGSNTGVPESMLIPKSQLEEEQKVINLAQHKKKIAQEVESKSRGRINLSDSRLQEVASDTFDNVEPKVVNPNKMSKEEFVAKATKDKEKQSMLSKQHLSDSEGNVVEFKNYGKDRSNGLPTENFTYGNGHLTHIPTGETFQVSDLNKTPLYNITKAKGIPRQTWSAISDKSQHELSAFLSNAIEKDPVLEDMFKPLKDAGVLNLDVTKKTINDFFEKYYTGNVKDLQAMMHKFHVDDFKTNKILDEEIGHYGGLTPKERAMRMERKYELLNNPKETQYKYAELDPHSQVGVTKLDNAVTDSFDKANYGVSKTADEAYQARIKANSKEYALKEERDLEQQAVKQTGVMYKDGKKVNDIEFLDSNYKQVLIGHDADAKIRNISDLEKEGFKVWNPNTVTGSSTKSSGIGKMYKDNQSEAERLILEQENAKKAKQAEKEVATSKVEEEVTKLQEADKQVIEKPVEQPVAKPNVEEYKKADISIEEAIGKLPQEIEDAIQLNKVNKASADIKQAKINKLLTEYTQAMSNDAEFERYARSVWGDKTLNQALKEQGKNMTVIQKLDLLPKDVADIVYDIRDKFKKVAKSESAVGQLDNFYLEGYVGHILTPKAKAYIDSLDEKALADLGIERPKVKLPGNGYDITREYKPGMKMPDGYVLKYGTVAEINQHMKYLLEGDDFFTHEIADVYLARMQKHYKLMYDDGMVKDLVHKFGVEHKLGGDIRDNHSLIYSTRDLKKLLKGKNEETISKLLNRYGIDRDELDKIGNAIITVESKHADNMLKDGYVKVHQVPNVILEKYMKLNKAQVAEDINGLLGAYDKFLYAYKISATALRPAFHINNARGNMFNNYLDVGTKAFSPRLNNLVIGILRGHEGTVVLGGIEYSLKQIRREAEKLDVLGKGFFGYDVKKNIQREAESAGKQRSLLNIAVDTGMKVGSTVEEHGRLLNFVANLDLGKGFANSSEHVDKFLFNYDDITKFEHETMRRIFPFYTWMRKNATLQLEQMFENPKKYMPVAKALNEIRDMTNSEDRVDQKKLPAFAQDWIQLPFTVTNEKGQKEILMWNDSMPYLDLNRIPDLFHPSTVPSAIVPQLSPAIKIPLELGTNNNYYLQNKIDNGTKVLDPSGTFEVSPQLAYLLSQSPQYSEPASTIRKTGIDKFIGIMDKFAGTGVKSYNYGEYSKAFTGGTPAPTQNNTTTATQSSSNSKTTTTKKKTTTK